MNSTRLSSTLVVVFREDPITEEEEATTATEEEVIEAVIKEVMAETKVVMAVTKEVFLEGTKEVKVDLEVAIMEVKVTSSRIWSMMGWLFRISRQDQGAAIVIAVKVSAIGNLTNSVKISIETFRSMPWRISEIIVIPVEFLN